MRIFPTIFLHKFNTQSHRLGRADFAKWNMGDGFERLFGTEHMFSLTFSLDDAKLDAVAEGLRGFGLTVAGAERFDAADENPESVMLSTDE